MEETAIIPSAKTVFYTIKLLYPKYHPIWFILYMYLIYFRIAKRKLLYYLKPIPSKIIANILDKRYSDDINNTIIVNESNIYKNDKVLLLYSEGSNFYRPVYVLANTNCAQDNVLLSDTLYHNLTNQYSCKATTQVSLLEYKEHCIEFAEELDISVINSPYDISNAVTDTLLEKFFKIPKIVKIDDILEINIRYYAPDIFYRNSKINHVENIYLKVNYIKIKGNKDDKVCFCAVGQTEVKQSPNVQSYLPKRFYKQCFISSDEDLAVNGVPLCPYGLQEHLENLEKSVKPFFSKSK